MLMRRRPAALLAALFISRVLASGQVNQHKETPDCLKPGGCEKASTVKPEAKAEVPRDHGSRDKVAEREAVERAKHESKRAESRDKAAHYAK